MVARGVDVSRKPSIVRVGIAPTRKKSPVSGLLPTPWTEEVVDALARYQLHDVDPYLCGNPSHKGTPPRLVPTIGGFICESQLHPGTSSKEECFYIVQWAYKSSLTMLE